MPIPDADRPRSYSLAELPRGLDCDFFCYVMANEPLLTRSGKPYLRITIRDNTRSITFPVWRDAAWWMACNEVMKPGSFCKVRAAFNESAHGPQLDVRRVRAATDADQGDGFDPQRLLPPTRGDSRALFDAVRSVASTELIDEALKNAVLELLDDHQEAWIIQPGGRWHHAARGGLIEHTWFTIQNALGIFDRYVAAYPEMQVLIRRDLVIAGAIVHDIGRIMELRLEPAGAEKTTLGELVGHHVLGRDMVRDAARKHQVDSELLVRLEHILLSHHATPDFGSPIPPMTMEALLVHLADDEDARLIGAMEVLGADAMAEWTRKNNPTGQKWYRGPAVTPEKP